MRKIEAHCNSPEMAIKSQVSTDFLWHILKSIWTIDVEKTLKIFNKVKTLIAISEEEFNFIMDVIKWDEFKCAFYEKISLLEIPHKKRNNFTFEVLYESLYRSLVTCRTIEILQKSPRSENVEYEWDSFRKVVQNEHKTIFLKMIEEIDRYYIAQDLRSGKNKFFSKDTNHCIVETYAEIEFAGYVDKSRDILLLKSDWASHYIVFGDKAVAVSPSVEYYEGKYSFYTIDPVDSLVYQIDKETLKMTLRDFQNLNFIRINGRYILTFARPILLDWEEWKDYSQWVLSLIDIQNGQDVFFHLHQKHHVFTDTWFLWCSSDMQYYFAIDFRTWNKKTFYIEEFVPQEVIKGWNVEIWSFIRTINGAL